MQARQDASFHQRRNRGLIRCVRASIGCVLFAAGFCMQGWSQSPEFLPEIDAHLTVGQHCRVYFQAKDDRDEGTSNQLSIGPSVQFYLKPIVRLKEITTFDLNDARSRALVLEVGYRSVTAPNEAATNRMEPVLTTHLPLKAGFLMSDRNRADLDWKGGEFTWRYRNKLQVQRTVSIAAHHFTPYVAAEPYYVEQYAKWSTTDLYAGSELPLHRHLQINVYYEHANNTGKAPNQPKNYVGFVLELYFRRQ